MAWNGIDQITGLISILQVSWKSMNHRLCLIVYDSYMTIVPSMICGPEIMATILCILILKTLDSDHSDLRTYGPQNPYLNHKPKFAFRFERTNIFLLR